MFVSGPGLAQPVLFRNWSENGLFLSALVNAPRSHASLKHRPRFRLSLFWQRTASPVPTDPRKGNQFGWFYPAHGSRAAVVLLYADLTDRAPEVAPARDLAILARHGVPTRL